MFPVGIHFILQCVIDAFNRLVREELCISLERFWRVLGPKLKRLFDKETCLKQEDWFKF